jgi:hypothetical protein
MSPRRRITLAAVVGCVTAASFIAARGSDQETEKTRAQMEVLVVPDDPATAQDLLAALHEIRNQRHLSPADRIGAVDELFSLNRELLFRKIEPRSPESIKQSLQ